MTPRKIAAALDADPIAGLTHGLGSGPESVPPEDGEDPHLCLCAARAEVCLYVNADDFGEVIAVARRAKTFRVTDTTIRADLVEILAWSLNAVHPDPAAPETRAARLAICELTARVLSQGLSLLGIHAPDRM